MDGELRRQTLPDLLHRSAKRFPNKTAIICGDTAWSYAEISQPYATASRHVLPRAASARVRGSLSSRVIPTPSRRYGSH
jgi:fatty-acyl-CoA synthase